MEKLSLQSKIHEWKYWNVSRKTQKFIPWVARNLPNKVKYFVVISGMCEVEPKLNPSDVTGMQMLNLWGKEGER